MARPSKAAPPRARESLPLFAPDPVAELERAKAIARAFPLDARFEQLNGGRPYWRALWSRQGQRFRKYVGTIDDVDNVQRAHELVRADMIAQGYEPPHARKRRPSRKVTRAPARPQKPNGARGGRRSTAEASLRDTSAATDHVEGDRSPVAANGSRRRR